MHLSKEAVAEREALSPSPKPVFQRRHVVRHLYDIIERNARHLRPPRRAEDRTATTVCPRFGRTAGPLSEVAVREKGACLAAASRGRPRGQARATRSPEGLVGPTGPALALEAGARARTHERSRRRRSWSRTDRFRLGARGDAPVKQSWIRRIVVKIWRANLNYVSVTRKCPRLTATTTGVTGRPRAHPSCRLRRPRLGRCGVP